MEYEREYEEMQKELQKIAFGQIQSTGPETGDSASTNSHNFTKLQEEETKEEINLLPRPKTPSVLTAACFSGGGARACSFALGIMIGLYLLAQKKKMQLNKLVQHFFGVSGGSWAVSLFCFLKRGRGASWLLQPTTLAVSRHRIVRGWHGRDGWYGASVADGLVRAKQVICLWDPVERARVDARQGAAVEDKPCAECHHPRGAGSRERAPGTRSDL